MFLFLRVFFGIFSLIFSFTTSISFADGFSISSIEKDNVPSGFLVHNHVILKVKGKTLTVVDVVHKLNVLFFAYYESFLDSVPARTQFYNSMWQTVFDATVDEFLMAADAEEKKIQIESTDVKQEIIRLFGEKITKFTTSFDMTYDDVYQTVFRMLISQKLLSIMVRSKASLAVTPRMVKEKYKAIAEETMSEVLWHYSLINVRATNSKQAFEIAERIGKRLNEAKVWDEERVKAVAAVSGGQVSFSNSFSRKNCDLSDSHKKALLDIIPESLVSQPVAYKNDCYQLFVLHSKEVVQPRSFSEMEEELKRSLIEEKLVVFDKSYRDKLRYRYGYDSEAIPGFLSEFNGLFSWL